MKTLVRIALPAVAILSILLVSAGSGTVKVVVCHATSSETNPYVRINVSVHSVDDANGLNGHGEHENDIWAPFVFEGITYPGQGDQSILENDCKIPEPTKTPGPTHTPEPTNTLVPTVTNTPVPTDTNTPLPTATGTLPPTATPIMTSTNTLVFTPTSTPTLPPSTTTSTLPPGAPTQTPTPTSSPAPTDTPTNTTTATLVSSVLCPTFQTDGCCCSNTYNTYNTYNVDVLGWLEKALIIGIVGFLICVAFVAYQIFRKK